MFDHYSKQNLKIRKPQNPKLQLKIYNSLNNTN